MGFIQRLFGICQTSEPGDPTCWSAAGETITINLAQLPELAEPGSAVRIEGPSLPMPVLLVHGEDGELRAYQNKCGHGGRRVDRFNGDGQLECCSLGKSRYDQQGRRLSGPASRDLLVLPLRREADQVTVEWSPPADS